MIRYSPDNAWVSNVTKTVTVYDTFVLPFLDFDGVIAKCVAQTFGCSPVDVYVQTSDDGGTTFYDCAHFNIGGTVSAANALWQQIPNIIGDGRYLSNVSAGSISAGAVGLPLLSKAGRVYWVFTSPAGTSVINATVSLIATQQTGGQY